MKNETAVPGRFRPIAAAVHTALLAAFATAVSAQAVPQQAEPQTPAATPNPAAQPGGADQTQAGAVQEVVVTGSRIARPDYVADSPIVTVSHQALETGGQQTLDSQLQRLPQFTAGQGNGGQGSGETATGAGFGNLGAATVNLRNLGDNRTLVLLDGRRMQPSTTLFAVDVNQLPASIIESVEVITGGASAVYGSDAVAGVVNFKLRHHFQGFQLDAHETAAEHDGYGVQDVSLLTGTNFAENRGNVMVAVDYYNRNDALLRDVPFYQRGMQMGTGAFAYQFLATGYYEPFAFTTRVVPGVSIPNFNGATFGAIAAALGAPPGDVPITPTLALGFNDDHTTMFNRDPSLSGRIYDYTTGVYPQNPLYAINNGVKYNANYDEFATTPMRRYSVFARSEYEITDHVTAYTQGLYTHYSLLTNFMPLPADNFWNVQIPFDPATDGPGGGGPNPVPQSLYDILTSRPDASAPWAYGRSLQFLGPGIDQVTNDLFQVIAGLRGDIPGSDITWDLYGSHGEVQITSHTQSGFASTSRYQMLMTAPGYGAGFSLYPGGPSCTSGISPFISDDQVTADCKAFLNANATNITTQHQDIVEGTMQGKITDIPSGALRFAVGADYRRNSYASVVDNEFQGTPQFGGITSDVVANFAMTPSAGALHVAEVYGELLVPILKDLPAVKSLDADLGYRYSDYSNSGGVHTYKADLNWNVAGGVRFRGGYERAIRAPNVIEAYGATQSTISLPAFDPCVTIPGLSPPYGNNAANPHQAQVQALCAAMTGGTAADYANYAGQGTPVLVGQLSGNQNLKPEKADTYTFGVTYASRADLPLGGTVSASADYYHIKVDGAIEGLTADDVYRLCFNSNGTSNPTYSVSNPYCSLIVRSPITTGGLPETVLNLYQNEGGIKTQGIDLQGDLAFNVGPGRVDFNVLFNYLLKFETSIVPGAPFLDYAGSISSDNAYFRTRTLVTTSYALGPASFGVRWKHLPSAADVGNVTGCGAACLPGVPHYDRVDLFGSWDVSDAVRLTAGIDNVNDADPLPLAGTYGNTNTGEYDVVGRSYWVAVRVQFH